jgi:hypothetical protein
MTAAATARRRAMLTRRAHSPPIGLQLNWRLIFAISLNTALWLGVGWLLAKLA